MRILISLCFAAFLVSADTLSGDGAWIIDKQSQLIIYGSTNINNFTCSIASLTKADTLEYVFDDQRNEILFSKNLMTIPVNRFDCGNPLITRDFMETLKSTKYPNLAIKFISLDKVTPGNVKGTVEIKLAGVSRRYSIQYVLSHFGDDKQQLSGKHKVNFSDFSLEAPQKMMGLIKVRESLEVEFRMILLPIP